MALCGLECFLWSFLVLCTVRMSYYGFISPFLAVIEPNSFDLVYFVRETEIYDFKNPDELAQSDEPAQSKVSRLNRKRSRSSKE